MLAKGWTQAGLAEQTSLSRDRISSLIRGLSEPTVEEGQHLAAALGVEPKHILPLISVTGESITVSFDVALLAALDAYASDTSAPSRPEAVRALVQERLAARGYLKSSE
jgi:transcriptional regulator with XRE-family HTH domain